MIKVKDSPHHSPDVSRIRPIYVPVNSLRSDTVNVKIINHRGKYQLIPGYWDDIDKCWRRETNGDRITDEVADYELFKDQEMESLS